MEGGLTTVAKNQVNSTTILLRLKDYRVGEVCLCDYDTMADMIERLPYFINEVYNI